jgi:hypothetical protein
LLISNCALYHDPGMHTCVWPLSGTIPLQLVVQKHLFTNPQEPVSLEVQFEWNGGNTTIKVSEAGSPKVPTWDCSRPDLNLTMQVGLVQI